MARVRPKVSKRRFVLDCSIVLAWYFVDEANSYADSVASSLTNATAVVPTLFHLEVANALVVGERRKRGTEAQAATFLKRIASLPIVVDDETVARAWSDTIALARTHGLSSYDAAYLELAMRESIELATLDAPLRVAALAVGVPTFKP